MIEIGHFGKNILKYMKIILNKLACCLSQILQASLSLDMPQADISNLHVDGVRRLKVTIPSKNKLRFSCGYKFYCQND